MKEFLFALTLCLSLEASCQPDWDWANSYGVLAYHEYTNAMCTDPNGTSYITGTFQTSIIFGNDTLSRPGGGIFIAKFDSSGNPLWAISPETSGLEINTMTLDDSGHVYLAGALSGTVIFGSDTVSSAGNHKDFFVGKFDVNLNLIWAQLATGFADNLAYGVAVNNNSEVYLTGIYDTSITIGTTFLQGSHNADNIFVAKYDINGNNLWALSSKNNRNPVVSGVTCDNFDHVCISGHFVDTLSFGGDTLISTTAQAIFLVQFDAAGIELWTQKSGGFPSTGYEKCITSDSAGNYYCAGFFNSPVMIFGSDTLVNAGFNDLFLVKYDNLGNLIWSKSAGGPDYDEADAIITDNQGNIYMTGFFKGFISFGATFLTGPFQDLYIAKYDPNGNVLWATSATGSINERGFGIGLDNFNHVYVNGDFTSPTTSFNQYTITNTDQFTGSYDIFFARLGENPTGVNDPDSYTKESLIICPNPASGFCRIVNEQFINSTLRIYDAQGRMINESVMNSDKVIDLKNISPGIYFVQLSSKSEIRNGKLVVQ